MCDRHRIRADPDLHSPFCEPICLHVWMGCQQMNGRVVLHTVHILHTYSREEFQRVSQHVNATPPVSAADGMLCPRQCVKLAVLYLAQRSCQPLDVLFWCLPCGQQADLHKLLLGPSRP